MNTATHTCGTCHGTGDLHATAEGTAWALCTECHGTGKTTTQRP